MYFIVFDFGFSTAFVNVLVGVGGIFTRGGCIFFSAAIGFVEARSNG